MNENHEVIHDALRDLIPFVQFKKREKHPWKSDTFSKVAEFCNVTKSITPPWVFFTFSEKSEEYSYYLCFVKVLSNHYIKPL